MRLKEIRPLRKTFTFSDLLTRSKDVFLLVVGMPFSRRDDEYFRNKDVLFR